MADLDKSSEELGYPGRNAYERTVGKWFMRRLHHHPQLPDPTEVYGSTGYVVNLKALLFHGRVLGGLCD